MRRNDNVSICDTIDVTQKRMNFLLIFLNAEFFLSKHEIRKCEEEVGATPAIIGELCVASMLLLTSSSLRTWEVALALGGLCQHNIWHHLGISSKNYAPA